MNESLPNIVGNIGGSSGGNVVMYNNANLYTTKSLSVNKISDYGMDNVGSNTDTRQYKITFDAHDSNAIYQNNAHVQQAALCLNIVIKY